MREAVDLLLAKAKSIRDTADEDYNRITEQADRRHREKVLEADGLVKAAQEVCLHDGGVREEQHEDYHKHEEWTETYCVVCGKRLRG